MTSNRWVDQTRIHDAEAGVRGDCARAAIASLFALPLDAVPDFNASDALAFYDGIEGFFVSLGYELYRIDRDVCFDALHLASGPSPRGVSHMVVRRGSEIIHDPHPSRAGLLKVEHVTVPIPLDPDDAERPLNVAPRNWRARDKTWAPWNFYVSEAAARKAGWLFVERVPA